MSHNCTKSRYDYRFLPFLFAVIASFQPSSFFPSDCAAEVDSASSKNIRQQVEALPAKPPADQEKQKAEKLSFAEWDQQLRDMEASLLEQIASKEAQPAKTEPVSAAQPANLKSEKSAYLSSNAGKSEFALTPEQSAPKPEPKNETDSENASEKDSGRTRASADIEKLELENTVGRQSAAGKIDSRFGAIEDKTDRIESAIAALEESIQRFQAKMERSQQEGDKEQLNARLDRLENDLTKQAEVSASLSRSLEQLIDHYSESSEEGDGDGSRSLSSLGGAAVVNEIRNLREKYARLQATSEQHAKALTSLERSTGDLKDQFNSAQHRIESLLSEVADSTQQLMARKVENVFDARSEKRQESGDGPLGRFHKKEPSSDMDLEVFDDWEETDLQPDKAGDDSPTAFIISKAADLRAEPSKRSKILVTMPRSASLTVEKRVGDWYRVIALGGKRAWAHSDDIAFGNTYASLPKGALAIRAVDK